MKLHIALASVALVTAFTPATAASLNQQINICETAITQTAQTAFDTVDVDYRSQGGGQKVKKLQFMVEAGGKWGKASCSISGEEIVKLKWPSSLKKQIAAVEVTATQLAAEDAVAGSASSN